VLEWGEDGCFLAFGTMAATALAAAKELAELDHLHFGVVSMRFVKPIDREMVVKVLTQVPAVLTVEEGVLEAGFGSAVLECANAAGIEASHVTRLGIPDKFVEHGERHELLADLGLDVAGLVNAARKRVGPRELLPLRKKTGTLVAGS
jgi:1-deoxy-D-xylulose-5-phosphate synthase